MQKPSFVLLILLSGLLFAGTASASPTVTLNGQPLTFDVPPLIDNGRAMVPLRATFEALGATVRWDAGTRTIAAAKGDASIQLTVGDTSATRNGARITLDAPPRIVDGRTLVPLRFIGEALGCQVNWDDSTQTVSISDAPSGTSPASQPATSRIVLEVGLTNSQGSENNAFEVTSAEPYFKVWIENTSASRYTVRVTRGSTSGMQVGLTTVSPGSQGIIYSPGPVSAGTYWVSMTSDGGYPLSGHLAVRTAAIQADLDSIVN